jgi:trehalose 6-phosphate synthase
VRNFIRLRVDWSRGAKKRVLPLEFPLCGFHSPQRRNPREVQALCVRWIEEVGMRVVVISNRVAFPKGDEPIDGGLAAALLPAVRNSGAIWLGASGRLADPGEKGSFVEVQALGKGAVATIDMPRAHYAKFYEGFANAALWPVLHSRTDLIRVGVEEYGSYRAINEAMARAALRFARPDAVFWVHDYHYMMLGRELRRLGVERPIGFFLHTPFPSRHTMLALPHHRELIEAMLAYDLIGFQTDEDTANFVDYAREEFDLSGDDTFVTPQGLTQIATFPIGIDVESFAERAIKSATRPEVSRLRSSLQGAQLVIGVDRVDYSKGLPNRFRAFARMLQLQPHLKRAVSLLQIAVPSRGQVAEYRQLQGELAAIVGEINGRYGEVDWTPIRYLNRGFPQTKLAGFYRTARVGLVTSLYDGMNLVAKEYVAAQNPLDPGVLVLSKFAGAAKQLDAALLVNPHDIDGVAWAISSALAMRREERRDRWVAMMEVLRSSSLDDWFQDFLFELSATPRADRSDAEAGVVATRRRPLELAALPGA